MSKGSNSFSIPGLALLLLLFWAVAVGAFILYQMGARDYVPYLVLLAVPVFAFGLMMLVIAVAPGLLPGGEVRWPANVALPLVYVSLMIACASMGTSTGNSLVLPNQPSGLVAIWFEWRVLLFVASLQIVSLTFLGIRKRPVAA